MNQDEIFKEIFCFVVGLFVSIVLSLIVVKKCFLGRKENFKRKLLFDAEKLKRSGENLSENSVVADWMLISMSRRVQPSRNVRLRLIYSKIYENFVFLHFPSRKIQRFRKVFLFDLSKSEVRLKSNEEKRSDYWSKKSPLIVGRIRFFASFRIEKKSKQISTSVDRLRHFRIDWNFDNDEIHFFYFDRRTKEDWFYRLNSIPNKKIQQNFLSKEEILNEIEQSFPDRTKSNEEKKKFAFRFSSSEKSRSTNLKLAARENRKKICQSNLSPIEKT